MLPIATSAKAADDFDLAKVERQSVQDLPDAQKNGATQALWFGVSNNGPLLAPWGTRERERQLRLYDRHEYNTMWQGAKMGLIKKVKATPWLINGGRNSVNYFQRLFRDAQFGYGWGDFISRFLSDYMRADGGAYAELIAPGNPLKPPTGAITGIAHLDSFNCLPTGDPEYPVVYWSRLGKLHLMHRTRILHMVDMPDGDQWNPGYGLCALSRAIAVVEREMLMGRYIEANLNDKPSPGFIIAHNLARSARDQAVAMYRQEQGRDYPPEWGNVIWLESVDKENPPSLENVTFSRPPEKFDYKVYVDIDVDMLALAIGVDHQDLFPLQSRSMGSGAQSEILHEKSKGKAYGDMLISLERALNDVLPESLEFSFKTSDGGQALQDAQIAVSWTTAINQAGARLGMEEGRQLLANQIEAINQVVTDEAGQIVALTDLDVEPITEQQRLNSPLDPAPASTEQAQPQATATDATQNAPASKPAKKDFDATRAAFVSNLTDLIHGSLNDDVSRRRAGIVMRAQLNSAGKQARADGLADGGVTTGLSDADLNQHAIWLSKQSAFVTDFMASVYKSGLSDAEVEQHSQMWANKSLQSAYFEGLQSADANGMYEFFGDDGKESCADCQRLKGVQMRMSEWTATKQRPGVDTEAFSCKGFNCAHGLRKVQKNS